LSLTNPEGDPVSDAKDDMPEWMRKAFSDSRLAPYLRATQGDAAAAARLYWWNMEVSAALYGPLHCLEVTLRNAMNDQLRTRYERPDWWTTAPLSPDSQKLVDKARHLVAKRHRGPISADGVVAELNFGFWASLLSRGRHSYDRLLWVPTLHKAFPRYSGKRALLYDNLSSLVLLRNRIMHYEPVHHRDLAADHAKVYRLLGYITPLAAKEILTMDRFPAVLSRRDDAASDKRPASF
jgi:hypothetical protein